MMGEGWVVRMKDYRFLASQVSSCFQCLTSCQKLDRATSWLDFSEILSESQIILQVKELIIYSFTKCTVFGQGPV